MSKFHVAIVDEKHFVPEVPQASFPRYADALADVLHQTENGDLEKVVSGLGTVTGDGSKGIGATELATIVDEWKLDDGRFIHIYRTGNRW